MTTPDLANDFQASTAGRAEVLQDIRKWLNLDKLTVIRGGWKFPETFERARKAYYEENGSWWGGKENESRYRFVKAAFDKELALASKSLRGFIAQQDEKVAARLTSRDIHSLLRFGHVTLRSASTKPVSAVVVFDCIEDGSTPDRNWALGQLVRNGKFVDGWEKKTEADPQKIPELPVADFIENFDINPLDLYAHQILLRVHYALQHENQLVNNWGRLDEQKNRPRYQSFAKLTEIEYPREFTPYAGQREYQDTKRTAAEVDAFQYINQYERDKSRKHAFGYDERFYAKLARIEAIESVFPISFGDAAKTTLRRLAGEPGQGWMHYYAPAGEEIARGGLSREDAEKIEKEFTTKLIEVLKEDRPDKEDPDVNIFSRIFDLRVLIPAFRKLYEADESKGTQRAFLNIINEGLEKYFPTLLNSPMPGWTPQSEPPKTIDGYKTPQPVPVAKPSSSPAPK